MRSSAFSDGDARVVDDDFAIRIDAVNGFLGRLRLGPAHVGVRVQNLALEIGIIHGVEIHDAESCRCRRRRDTWRWASRGRPRRCTGRWCLDFLLAGQADFRQNQVPRVTADFVIVQFHKSKPPPRGSKKFRRCARRSPSCWAADFITSLTELRVDKKISYAKIPGFPKPTVSGHAGELYFGHLGKRRCWS
jgi:hypothetical protein